METWITDTPISRRFPYYTRANADEVGPDPFSPLGWSLVWTQGCIPGVAKGFVEFGVVAYDEYDLDPPQVFGNWGGYFYNPMSLSRLMGVRMPGATAEAIDKAYFGDHPGVPPYEPHPDDENEAATAKLAETMAWVMTTDSYPEQAAVTAMAQRVVAERPDLSRLSNAELVAYARSMAPLVEQAWIPYCVVCLAASLGPGAVQAICEAVGRSQDAVTVLSAVDDVESAEASFSMWDLGRIVRGSPSLTAAFDAAAAQGFDGFLERLDTSEPGVADFVASWQRLIADHGHRAPNEWDARPDSWTTRPQITLGMIERLRFQSDDRSPHLARVRAAQERRRVSAELLDTLAGDPDTQAMLASALTSAALFLGMRERGKYACIRLIHEVKLAMHELGRRMQAAGVVADRRHVFNLLDSELDAFIADPGSFSQAISEREASFQLLHQLEPPYIVGHAAGVQPIASWPQRNGGSIARAAVGDVLTGAAGSSGVARGRARIVLDPGNAPADLGAGDILVAPTTDPAWVPLFLAVEGVIVNVGAVGSHAAIVCREIGVPCAVSVIRATDRITEGAIVELNGSTGTVTIIG